MMMKLLVLVFALAFACANPISGKCPDPPAALNFNSTAFTGIWFDQAHTRRGTGLDLKCDLVRFSSSSNNKLAFNSFTYSSATKQTIGVSGEADVPSPSVGKLQVHIPSLKLNGEVRVLSTDYSTFAVLWACNNADDSHNDRVLILTRDKHPSNNLMSAATRVLENNNISKKDLSESTQHKCHDYDLNATGLSNSLGPSTSMGSLLSVFNASPASSPSSTTPSTTTASSSKTTASLVNKLADKAKGVLHSIG